MSVYEVILLRDPEGFSVPSPSLPARSGHRSWLFSGWNGRAANSWDTILNCSLGGITRQGIMLNQRTRMVLFVFLVSVRSAKISASKIIKVKKLFIYLVKYGTKTSAKISAKFLDVLVCN